MKKTQSKLKLPKTRLPWKATEENKIRDFFYSDKQSKCDFVIELTFITPSKTKVEQRVWFSTIDEPPLFESTKEENKSIDELTRNLAQYEYYLLTEARWRLERPAQELSKLANRNL